MVLGMLALVLQSAPPATIDRSNAKWEVNYSPDGCTITHPFRNGPHASILAIDAHPATGDGNIVLMIPRASQRESMGTANITIAGGAKIQTQWIAMAGTPDLAAFRLIVSASDFPKLLAADRMTVAGIADRPVEVPVKGLPKAIDAAKTCGRALLTSWGADPEAMIDVGDGKAVANWVKVGDYPVAALSANQQGIVKLLLTINAKGRPTNCKAVVSSRSAALDTTSCRILMDRAHFEPSTLAARYVYTMITWVLPG